MRRTEPSGLEVFLGGTDPSRPHDWASDGYRSREEYLFWSRKVCGLACLQSLLLGWTDVRLPMRELLAQALDRGCYVAEPSGKVQGLIYRPFMAWVGSQFGFHCELVENTPIHVSGREVRPGQVMIASVSPEIRDPGTRAPLRGGHLVLVYAVEDGVVRFHNPSGYSHNSDSTSLPLHVFERFHANRGILIAKTSWCEADRHPVPSSQAATRQDASRPR
ncbi:peptidase [Actinomadura sediminis]|uniref:Peptidase n=1 Tax=Actinomadura sediminis TaxID=1038904 RepID=A0ABW3EVA7_9ACTN